MSSQEAVHVSLMEVMPTSGKGTLGTWWFHCQRGGRTQSRHKPTHELELSYEQTIRSRGVCAPALKPRGEWEGSRTKCQGFKPDLGNSAVRHYRGAFENVAMVEMRTQLAIERAGLVTLHLQPARRSSIPTIDLGSGSGLSHFGSDAHPGRGLAEIIGLPMLPAPPTFSALEVSKVLD